MGGGAAERPPHEARHPGRHDTGELRQERCLAVEQDIPDLVVATAEEALPQEHLEHEEPEREDVAARIGAAAGELLGRRVRDERAQRRGRKPREHRVRGSLAADAHRPGCESAVDGAALVGVRERVGELARDVERVGGSKRSAFAQHPVQRLGVVEGLDQVIPLRLLSEVQHRHDVVVPEPDRPPDGILDERELRGIVGQRRGQDGHGEEVAEERVPGLVRRPRRAVAELLQHLVPAGDEGVALPRRGFDSSVVSRSLHAGCCSADAEGQDLCQEASRKSQVGRKRRASIA